MKTSGTARKSLEARIDALRNRHARIDAMIREELGRPMPNSTRLRGLKGRKLLLKDEMAYYAGVLRTLATGQSDRRQGQMA
jgi:hypothetical protein